MTMTTAVATRTAARTRLRPSNGECKRHARKQNRLILPTTSAQRCGVVAQAADGGDGSVDRDEVRVSAIENMAKMKGKRKAKLSIAEQEALRNKDGLKQGEGLAFGGGSSRKKNGSLWDQWAGEDGVLSSINDLTYKLALGMAFVWVLFRFVFPAIGVYKLVNDLAPPPIM